MRQAHPRRHDDLRLAAEAIAFLLLIALVVAMASLAPTEPDPAARPTVDAAGLGVRGAARLSPEVPGASHGRRSVSPHGAVAASNKAGAATG